MCLYMYHFTVRFILSWYTCILVLYNPKWNKTTLIFINPRIFEKYIYVTDDLDKNI